MNTISKFLVFLKPYWAKGILAFIFMLLSVILRLPMPFLTRYLIDKVIITKDFYLLNRIGFIIIGILVLYGISYYIERFLLIIFRGRVLFNIRTKLFEHIQKVSLSFFKTKGTGYLISRISDDVNQIQGLLAGTIVTVAQNIIIFVAGVSCMLYIHSKLALICFSVLPIYFLSVIVFDKRIQDMSYDIREQYALVKKDLHELISGILIIKAFTSEGQALSRMTKILWRAIRKEIHLDLIATIASLSSILISSAGPVILIWYGCAEIMRGNLSIGSLIAFNSFVGYLFGPARDLYNLNLNARRSLAAVKRIFEILDLKPEEEGEKEIEIKHGRVVFNNIFFSYDRNKPILKGISFEVNPGETVAIVGRSGVGKTTFVSLIPLFCKPNKGQILIDGVDTKTVKVKSLRSKIAICSQDTFLFSQSIRENIRFGYPDATVNEIINVAKLAYADIFIEKLPNGYETEVGERGVRLSGGECQRIAIARAIIRNPRILILDEATSQVDSESEYLIQKALNNLCKNRTTFIIAHRLSTILSTDKIFVLDDGRIIAQGKHNKIYNTCAIYRDLCNKQFLNRAHLKKISTK